MSHDPCSRSAVSACWLPPMSSSAIRRVSSAPRGGNPVIFTGTNWPLTSMCGRLPGEKIRSLTRVEARSIAESKVAAGIGLATAVLGTGTLAGLSRGVLLTLPAYVPARVSSSDQGHGTRHGKTMLSLDFGQAYRQT